MIFRRQQPQQQPPAPKTLETYAGTLEQILKELNIDPASARLSLQQGYGWSFRRGSAIIEVYVSDQEGRGYFQVLSPILHLPASGLLPLYRRLLELNLQLSNASLGVHQDVVYVFHERLLEGLDAVEANQIITMVAGYADDLDNQLINEFGGRLYSQA
jgi:hypothetical protein